MFSLCKHSLVIFALWKWLKTTYSWLARRWHWLGVCWLVIGCLSLKSMTMSAPGSPEHRKQRPVSMSSYSAHSTITYDSNTMPSDMPKKRRAPLPPSMMSQSMPTDLGHQTAVHPDGHQVCRTLFWDPVNIY